MRLSSTLSSGAAPFLRTFPVSIWLCWKVIKLWHCLHTESHGPSFDVAKKTIDGRRGSGRSRRRSSSLWADHSPSDLRGLAERYTSL